MGSERLGTRIPPVLRKAMTFADLATGTAVFLDANTIVYRYSTHPRFSPPSKDLWDRIERQELSGHTSPHLVGEAGYRLMTLEAITLLGCPQAGVGNRLRTNPTEV